MTVLSIKDFWKIVEETLDIDPRKQMKSIMKTIEDYSIDELYSFEAYFSHLAALLDDPLKPNDLFIFLSDYTEVYLSDDMWLYRRQRFVMLGKEIYDLALRNPRKFVLKLAHSPEYRHSPENVWWDYSGLYELYSRKIENKHDILIDVASDDAKRIVDNILNKLKKPDPEKVEFPDSIENMTFCFTGRMKIITKREAEALVTEKGGIVKSNVINHLTFLIKTSRGPTRKFKNAFRQETRILDEDTFLTLMESL